MKKIKNIFLKITKPSWKSIGMSVLLLVIIAILTATMLSIDFVGTPLEIAAYFSFVISALGLAYAVCVFIFAAPVIKRMTLELLNSHELTKKLISNRGFRTVITSSVAFGISIVNSVINAYLGISERSIWFSALAAYYIFIALMRSGLLIYHRTSRDYGSEALVRARKYTHCGVLLLILNATLSSAIAQMIFDDRGFEYKDWLIYAFAAYAFYKVITSVLNAVRARRQDDLTIQAIREINMVDAAVSILALQTALLHTFSDESVNISRFNTITGSVVSLFSLALSIMMIIRGNKIIKDIKYGK